MDRDGTERLSPANVHTLAVWLQARKLVMRFWQTASQDERISAGFRALAQRRAPCVGLSTLTGSQVAPRNALLNSAPIPQLSLSLHCLLYSAMTASTIPYLKSEQQQRRAESMIVSAFRAGITNPKELCNLMGQVQHESAHFTRLEACTNHGTERLSSASDDRNRLTPDEAQALASGPPSRNALGNTEPGDCYQFRARGYIGLTGRTNYATYGKKLDLDLIHEPELAAVDTHAKDIAICYWQDKVQPHKDARTDIRMAGAIINKGKPSHTPTDIAERQRLAAVWQIALDSGYLQEALQRHPAPENAQTTAPPPAPERPPQLSPQSLRLIQDSEQHVRELAKRHQLTWGPGMDNTVHALACAARLQGLSGITLFHVAQERMRFAQYDGICIKEGELSTLAAVNTPAQASLRQMAQADQQALAPNTPSKQNKLQAHALSV